MAAERVTDTQRRMEGFPNSRASLHMESVRLALAPGREDEEVRARALANALYEELGSTRRVRGRPVVEYERMFLDEASFGQRLGLDQRVHYCTVSMYQYSSAYAARGIGAGMPHHETTSATILD